MNKGAKILAFRYVTSPGAVSQISISDVMTFSVNKDYFLKKIIASAVVRTGGTPADLAKKIEWLNVTFNSPTRFESIATMNPTAPAVQLNDSILNVGSTEGFIDRAFDSGILCKSGIGYGFDLNIITESAILVTDIVSCHVYALFEDIDVSTLNNIDLDGNFKIESNKDDIELIKIPLRYKKNRLAWM